MSNNISKIMKKIILLVGTIIILGSGCNRTMQSTSQSQSNGRQTGKKETMPVSAPTWRVGQVIKEGSPEFNDPGDYVRSFLFQKNDLSQLLPDSQSVLHLAASEFPFKRVAIMGDTLSPESEIVLEGRALLNNGTWTAWKKAVVSFHESVGFNVAIDFSYSTKEVQIRSPLKFGFLRVGLVSK